MKFANDVSLPPEDLRTVYVTLDTKQVAIEIPVLEKWLITMGYAWANESLYPLWINQFRHTLITDTEFIVLNLEIEGELTRSLNQRIVDSLVDRQWIVQNNVRICSYRCYRFFPSTNQATHFPECRLVNLLGDMKKAGYLDGYDKPLVDVK